jgi:hypothetical protein
MPASTTPEPRTARAGHPALPVTPTSAIRPRFLGSPECRCRFAVWLGCLLEVSGSLFDAATAGRVLTVRPSQAPSLPGVTAGLSAEFWRA